MTEHPILFSGPMIHAILQGKKTQTRRAIKPQPSVQLYQIQGSAAFAPAHPRDADVPDMTLAIRCPYGQPGDRLWVRETWSLIDDHDAMACVGYAAGPGPDWARLWFHCGSNAVENARKFYGRTKVPSIFMPRWASRITLEITNVRVERVQAISDADIRAEGCERLLYRGYASRTVDDPEDFSDLWDAINARRGYSWESNPFVWVVSFKRVEHERSNPNPA